MPTSLTDIFQDGVSRNTKLGPGTLYSARSNSNGPSPLHGQIQMSTALGKIYGGKFPREGTSAEVFKCRTFARTPPPLPRLRLNIRDLKIRGRRRQRKRR